MNRRPDDILGLAGQPRSQGWKTFLCNDAAGIAATELFVVRSTSFKLLYGLVILRHARRRLVRMAVTSTPTAEWIAGEVTEAFPGMKHPSICSASATQRSARPTFGAFVRWASAITQLRRALHGKMDTSSG